MNFKKLLVGATASLAVAAGAVGATAGSASADSDTFRLCSSQYLSGGCVVGLASNSNLSWISPNFNDKARSIQTQSVALDTWNDANYRGTYGYFQPWTTWNTLSYPYDRAITSVGPHWG
ncbi:hypothetical protein ACIBAC_40665 [Streptomyces sp. NPDC051362]|uniref:hypothetical protein n=1 Tax=Streptomyces sp. NPDC051362 TaxID=3365651 RepID=UPI0037A62C4F